MKLIDYLPYYLGCDYWTNNSQGNLNAKTLPDVIDMIKRGKDVQLHLRRLEDITEDEAGEIGRILGQPAAMVTTLLIIANNNFDHRLGPSSYFKIMPFLTRLHFDLFNIIENGLALDIKTIAQ
jgi:hypothetical protein